MNDGRRIVEAMSKLNRQTHSTDILSSEFQHKIFIGLDTILVGTSNALLNMEVVRKCFQRITGRGARERYIYKVPPELEGRGIIVGVTIGNDGVWRLWLKFSASRIRFSSNLIPALPEDHQHIIRTLSRVLALVPGVISYAPLNGSDWTLRRVDFFADSIMDRNEAKYLFSALSGLPFLYSHDTPIKPVKRFQEFWNQNNSGIDDDSTDLEFLETEEDSLERVEGVCIRNTGIKILRAHVIYDKQIETLKRRHDLVHLVPPKLIRDEIRFYGKRCLSEIGFKDFTLSEALSFPDRTAPFRFIVEKHGISLDKDIDPRQDYKADPSIKEKDGRISWIISTWRRSRFPTYRLGNIL